MAWGGAAPGKIAVDRAVDADCGKMGSGARLRLEETMKKVSLVTAFALLLVAIAASAEPGKTPEKMISGSIARLDTASRTITVADAKGVQWTILWNDSTRVLGGELKQGQAVQLGYVESEGKNWATWIRVGEAKQ